MRLPLLKADSTGDMQLVSGYVFALRESPFDANTIVGVEAVDAPGYYDFGNVELDTEYEKWAGVTVLTLARIKASPPGGEILFGSSYINTGKTVESLRPNRVGRFFATIQEAVTDAAANSGNVIVHKKSTVYNEAITLANNVDIILEEGAIIETNIASPCFTANGVTCSITGEGIIRQVYNGSVKQEAIKIINGSNVTVKNKSVYARGSQATTASTIKVTDSIAKIFCERVESTNGVCLNFGTGSSGVITVLDRVVSGTNQALSISTSGDIEVYRTLLQGGNDGFNNTVVSIASTGGTKLFVDTTIESLDTDDDTSGMNITENSGEIILSGVDIIVDEFAQCSIFAFDPTDIYIRKPSWGVLNVNTALITMKGQWSYGYN